MKAWRSLLLVALATGCMYAPERSGIIECACPRGEPPVHQISLQTATGNWGCSPHSLGFYREVDSFAIKLPARPPAGEVRYVHTQLTLSKSSASTTVATTGGFVTLDATHRSVTVSLEVPEGSFWANGVYPVHEFYLN